MGKASCKKVCISALCKARKNCACQCEATIGGTNPALLDACLADCWDTPDHLSQYSSTEDYLCSRMDPQQLYNHHGYLCPSFDPLTGTAQGAAYKEQQNNINQPRTTAIIVLIVLAIMVVVLFAYYMRKKKSKK